MPLHRYITPTYFGGLPGTHDLINVISGGVGLADGSSPVAGPKGVGPNIGTYFVAFGEDGTSFNTNRGMKALSENTDFLDDAIHRDLAVPAVTLELIGTVNTSLVVSGAIFVGEFGAPSLGLDGVRNITGLFTVIDSAGEPLHVDTGGGVYVGIEVTAVEDGLSTNVIGVPPDGFYTNPTIFFSLAIPAGQAYRVAYFKRGNLLDQSVPSFTRERHGDRGAPNLHALAKTTRFGNVTFTGDKTFQNDVFMAPSGVFRIQGQLDTPRIVYPDHPVFPSTEFYQIEEGLMGSGAFRRTYLGGTFFENAEVFNARWDTGTAMWVPDIFAQNLKYEHGLSSGADAVYRLFEGAPFADADWFPASVYEVYRSGSRGFGFETDRLNDFSSTLNRWVASFLAMDASQGQHEDNYFFVMDFGGRVSTGGEAGQYYAYEWDDIAAPGLAFVRGAHWNALGGGGDWRKQSDGSSEDRAAVQVTQARHDVLRYRRKTPQGTLGTHVLPASWGDDEWDIDVSLQGLRLATWQVAEWSLGGRQLSGGLAVRPRSKNRTGGSADEVEVWVSGLIGGGAANRTVAFAPHPSGPWYEQSILLNENVIDVVWDEDATLLGTQPLFYALSDGAARPIFYSTDGKSLGGTTWPLLDSWGVAWVNKMHSAGAAGAVGWDPSASGDIREATDLSSGPITFNTRTVGVGPLFEVIYCSKSALWVAVGTATVGEEGIWTSPDRVTWTPAAVGGASIDTGGASSYQSVAYNFDDNVVFACGNLDPADERVNFAVSLDGGVTWSRVNLDVDRGLVVINDFGDSEYAVTVDCNATTFTDGRFVVVGQTEYNPGSLRAHFIMLVDNKGTRGQVVSANRSEARYLLGDGGCHGVAASAHAVGMIAGTSLGGTDKIVHSATFGI